MDNSAMRSVVPSRMWQETVVTRAVAESPIFTKRRKTMQMSLGVVHLDQHSAFTRAHTDALLEEFAAMKSRSTSVQEENKNLVSRLQRLRQHTAGLQKELDDSSKKERNLASEITRLQDELEEKNDTISILLRQVSSLKRDNDTINYLFTSQSKRMTDCKLQIKRLYEETHGREADVESHQFFSESLRHGMIPTSSNAQPFSRDQREFSMFPAKKVAAEFSLAGNKTHCFGEILKSSDANAENASSKQSKKVVDTLAETFAEVIEKGNRIENYTDSDAQSDAAAKMPKDPLEDALSAQVRAQLRSMLAADPTLSARELCQRAEKIPFLKANINRLDNKQIASLVSRFKRNLNTKKINRTIDYGSNQVSASSTGKDASTAVNRSATSFIDVDDVFDERLDAFDDVPGSRKYGDSLTNVETSLKTGSRQFHLSLE